jgi:FkbM family methyltransferase
MPHCRWPADRYVLDEVLRRRAYARLEIGNGDVVLDLGAHVGSFVRFALDEGAARVIAVEMLPETLALLRRNFPPGRYGNLVTSIWAAVTDPRLGPTAKTRYFQNPMGASVSRFNSADRVSSVEVPTLSLTSLLDTFRPTKLKFDIENSEYDSILPGVAEITASPVERIMGELHTRTPETLELARELWTGLDRDGWVASRHLNTFYEQPNGWNLIIAWKRGER